MQRQDISLGSGIYMYFFLYQGGSALRMIDPFLVFPSREQK